jgi:DNA-directed RNA polymerase specialized sigma24 family protein
MLDLLYEKPEELALCLDVLCRAALVLIGLEHYSPSKSAQVLNISRIAVESAYCAALEFLEVTCKMLMDSEVGARPCC